MDERNLVVVDLDLDDARRRLTRHPDPVSRAGAMRTVDALLDERLTLAPPRPKPIQQR